eukprot:2454199-Alexandrium_andersonii.AAC.1
MPRESACTTTADNRSVRGHSSTLSLSRASRLQWAHLDCSPRPSRVDNRANPTCTVIGRSGCVILASSNSARSCEACQGTCARIRMYVRMPAQVHMCACTHTCAHTLMHECARAGVYMRACLPSCMHAVRT